MAEGHTINGLPVSVYGVIESNYEIGLPDLAGDDVSHAYQEGMEAGNRTAKGREYPLLWTVVGDEGPGMLPRYTRSKYLSNAQDLAALVYNADVDGNSQPFTLGRTLPLSGGDQVVTITARYLEGMRFTQIEDQSGPVPWAARCAPVLRLLDAFWVTGTGTRVYL